MKLDDALRMSNEPVVFDEDKHLEKPFERPLHRYRYFANLQLSLPIDIIRFCPGGSFITIACINKVSEGRSEGEILIQGARLMQKVRPQLKEFHTCAQKKAFRSKLSNVTKVVPSVADMIYKELTLDASTSNHPATQE